MAKQFKTHTYLADPAKVVWAEGDFSQAQVNKLINAYKRAGVFLTAYGSPNQVLAQVSAINSMLDGNEIARNMREAGRLQVVGVGF